MPKKLIGVRLDEETIKKLEKKGKPSTVIRGIILESLKPPKPVEKVKPQVIVKEIPVEVIKTVDLSETKNEGFERETMREVILDEIREGKMPQWYIERRIKYFKDKYGEDVE